MKRKFTVVLLALAAALLLGLSVFFVACEFGQTHTHTMTYHEAVAATCTEDGNVAYWSCSGCGKNFSDEAGENELTSVTVPAKNHSFGKWVDNEDGETHTRTCSACTATEKEDHAFGAWVDNENGTHIRTCVCGATETESHSFGAWADDDNGTTHTRTCVCGATEPESHNFGDWADDDNGTTHTRTCSVCSATETEDHAFGAWADDDNGTTHTHTCTCGATETEGHSFGAWADNENGTHTRTCSVCSATETEDHAFGAGADNGDGTHIHTCSICGADETAAHVLDEETNSYCTVCDFISDYTQGLAYSYADGGYTVTGIGTATASNIIIPATYNDGVNGSAVVTEIGSSAFRDCSSLTEITIPEGVTSIGRYAFFGCSSLTEINYNAAAVADLSYNSSVFYHAGSDSAESTVIFGESVTSIPAYLFDAAGITSVMIGSNVTSIGSYAFEDCRKLTEITIPEGVTSIGLETFNNCSSLTEINYNAAAVADLIDNSNVFANAGEESDGITVIFGESVTSIPANLFCYNTFYIPNIVSVTIGSNVKSIGARALSGCSGLTEIVVAEGNPVYHSDGDCLIETATKTLILGCQNSVIPSDGSMISIGPYAFSGCSSLTEITIPKNVTSIRSYAFYDCSSLTEITIPENVTSIGEWAFYNCSSLTEITIPEGVTSIGRYAFYNCSSLTEITIPDSVTIIGSFAFRVCSNLTSVTFETTEGWWIASSSTATSGTEIAGGDLGDPSTAATYLKSRYYRYSWRRF